MFRASTCSSSGGKKLYVYSIWYRHTAIPRTDWEQTDVSPLSISAWYGSLQSVMIPDTVGIQSSWRWAHRCSKHVEEYSVTDVIKEEKICALSWWLIQVYTLMHGPKSVKKSTSFNTCMYEYLVGHFYGINFSTLSVVKKWGDFWEQFPGEKKVHLMGREIWLP